VTLLDQEHPRYHAALVVDPLMSHCFHNGGRKKVAFAATKVWLRRMLVTDRPRYQPDYQNWPVSVAFLLEFVAIVIELVSFSSHVKGLL
jgi:hypothetical protein